MNPMPVLGDRDHSPQKTEDFPVALDPAVFAVALAAMAGFSMR